MKSSENIELLAQAMAQFQGECPVVAFDSTNPFLKNKYASLSAIVQATKPHLAKNGLSVLQFVTQEGLATRIIHKSGQWIEGVTPMLPIGEEKGKSAAQVYGSIITYLRRYTFSAALGVVADEDTDGNALVKPSQNGQPKDEKAELQQKVRAALAAYKGDDIDDIKQMLNDKVKAKEDTPDFYRNVLKDLQSAKV